MDAMIKRLQSYGDIAHDDVKWFLTVPHRVVDVDPRCDIVRTGEPARDMFIVETGWALRYRLLDDGRRQIVNFMLPGDCFDLQAIVHAKADHSVTSVTPMRLRSTSSQRFLDALRGNGRMAAAFWWAAVQEESILREQIVRIGRRTARERIAHLMLELHRRLTIAGATRDESMVLPVTRDIIADALGLTPIHVSRTLTGLRAEGLLDAQGRQMHLLDRAGLAEVASFNPAYLHAAGADGLRPPKPHPDVA